MAKKKTLKQQDFQKKKLKVGKPKQQASNVTSTAFTARTISLPNQQKLKSAGNREDSGDERLEADILRRLSLCKHHSAVTRKETLVHFKHMVPRIITTKCMTPLLNSCYPLICDQDIQVRSALLELLEEIGQYDQNVLRLHSRALVLFINSSMTHIVPAVQRDSGKFLQCAVRYCGDELVRNSWVKMLKGMFSVLGWSLEAPGSKKSSKSVSMGVKTSSVVSMNSTKAKRSLQANLETLLEFVKCGCLEPKPDPSSGGLPHGPSAYDKYLIPELPQPYQHLKLFVKELKNEKTASHSKLEELNNTSFQDYATRREVLLEHFYDRVLENVENVIADGGECGRVAKSLKGTMGDIKSLQDACA
ncbi:Pre-rRNA-processing protein IPI1 [Lachancea thermotolerans]